MMKKTRGGCRGVKAKLKLLQKLCPDLSTALVDGEQLVYVERGYVVNWWGQLIAAGSSGKAAS